VARASSTTRHASRLNNADMHPRSPLTNSQVVPPSWQTSARGSTEVAFVIEDKQGPVVTKELGQRSAEYQIAPTRVLVGCDSVHASCGAGSCASATDNGSIHFHHGAGAPGRPAVTGSGGAGQRRSRD
jgi:hypothetical protein